QTHSARRIVRSRRNWKGRGRWTNSDRGRRMAASRPTSESTRSGSPTSPRYSRRDRSRTAQSSPGRSQPRRDPRFLRKRRAALKVELLAHEGHQTRKHFRCGIGLALKVSQHTGLTLSRDHVHGHGALLPESPATPDALVILLKRVRGEECHVRAVLKVEPP